LRGRLKPRLRPRSEPRLRSRPKPRSLWVIFRKKLSDIKKFEAGDKICHFLRRTLESKLKPRFKPRPSLKPKPRLRPRPSLKPKPRLRPRPSLKPKPRLRPRPKSRSLWVIFRKNFRFKKIFRAPKITKIHLFWLTL
jgi:hypothetical protein